MGINLRNLSTKSTWLRMCRESNACNQNRTHKYDGLTETYYQCDNPDSAERHQLVSITVFPFFKFMLLQLFIYQLSLIGSINYRLIPLSQAIIPPSTKMVSPVIYLASSDRNKMAGQPFRVPSRPWVSFPQTIHPVRLENSCLVNGSGVPGPTALILML